MVGWGWRCGRGSSSGWWCWTWCLGRARNNRGRTSCTSSPEPPTDPIPCSTNNETSWFLSKTNLFETCSNNLSNKHNGNSSRLIIRWDMGSSIQNFMMKRLKLYKGIIKYAFENNYAAIYIFKFFYKMIYIRTHLFICIPCVNMASQKITCQAKLVENVCLNEKDNIR